MVWLACLPLVANVVLALTGGRLARVLPPRVAVVLLPPVMAATAAATGVVLSGLGLLAAAQVPAVAVLGRWSARVVRADQPLPVPVEVVAGVVVLVLVLASSARAARSGRDLIRSAAMCRRLVPQDGRLVLVGSQDADAYAVPSFSSDRGRVVVSVALMRALTAQERRVVLAHEEAHLARGHHLWLHLALLAAAANPLLSAAARGVVLAVERDADEVAARVVADRRLAARALARAALARAGRNAGGPALGAPPGAMAAAASDVAQRAAALLRPAPRPRRVLSCGLVLLTVGALIGASVAADQVDDRLDRAQAARSAPG